MTETTSAPTIGRPRPIDRANRARRWSWAHYLAILGVPILVWNAWTVGAWLMDGPEQVTQFRDTGSFDWWVARVVEALVVLASLFVIRYLIRGCRREGKILTFDVMFCLIGATIFWSDYSINFFQPGFTASSNFVNLANTCGHQPFVVNPDCGRGPDPIWFILTETFLVLPLAIGAGRLASRLRERHALGSRLGFAGLVLAIAAVGCLAEILVIALDIWTYQGPSWMGLPVGHGAGWSLVVWIETAGFFGAMCLVHASRDDRGQTLVERGMEQHSARTRTAITMLALYACVQVASWVPGAVPMMAISFFQDDWEEMPEHLVNDLCDAPGVKDTRYGPCPGSDGFVMPVRGSLPGESP